MAYDFKEEKDVKEFLEKLGIEYRFGCYQEKNPEVCHLLGDYLEAIKKDFDKAAKVYQTNCDDRNFARSCYKFGNYTFLGRGQNKENPVQAFKYFDKGCELNDPDACLHAGLMQVANINFNKVGRDIRNGMKKLEKACGGGNGNACQYLSGMYISGVPKGGKRRDVSADTEFDVAKDMRLAFEYAFKACELKNVYACANLSQMYKRGEGTERNDELADKFKSRALEMQDELANQKATLKFQQGI